MKKSKLLILFFLFALSSCENADSKKTFLTPARTFQVAWSVREPYVTEKDSGVLSGPGGFDIQLIDEIGGIAHADLKFTKLEWDQSLEGIRNGTTDIVAGGYRIPEREAYAYFSEPYRTEDTVLILPIGKSKILGQMAIPSLFAELKRSGMHLGAVKKYYYGPDVESYLNSATQASFIDFYPNDADAFKALEHGKVDGLLIDRVLGASLLWKNQSNLKYEEYPTPIFSAPVAFMFSKKSVEKEWVDSFNQSMERMRESGKFQRIAANNMFPVLLSMTIGMPWFYTMLFIGTVAAAFAGLLIGRRQNYTLMGTLLLACAVSTGGGLCRDLIIGRFPTAIVRMPMIIIWACCTVLLGTLVLWIIERQFPELIEIMRMKKGELEKWSRFSLLEICDAVGLAALSIVGVVIAIEVRIEPLWLWGPVLGALTSVGGGILGNILIGDAFHESLIESFYLEIPVLWGLILSSTLNFYTLRGDYHPDHVFYLVLACVSGAFITRIAAIYFGWKGLKFLKARLLF